MDRALTARRRSSPLPDLLRRWAHRRRALRITWCAVVFVGLTTGAYASDDDLRRCQALAAKVPDTALEHCERALQGQLSRSQQVDALVNSAVAWRTKGDAAHAVQALDRALLLDPNHADARVMRGVARQHLGDASGALSDLDAAVRVRPDAAAYGARGDARRRQGNLEGAIADYGAAIQLAPQRAIGFRVRAAALLEKGDFESAEADYRQAQRIDPAAPAALRRLGIAQFLARHFAESASTLADALTGDPADLHAQLWRYLALRRANQPAAAEAALAQAEVAAKGRPWPAPLIEWFRQSDARQPPAPEGGAPEDRQQRQCDADFYVGEWLLTRADLRDGLEKGQTLLTSALEHCPRDSYAAMAARLERRHSD